MTSVTNRRRESGRNETPPPGRTGECLEELIEKIVGKKVLVADPASLEETAVGWHIGASVYPAKLIRLAQNCSSSPGSSCTDAARTRATRSWSAWSRSPELKGITLMKGPHRPSPLIREG